MIKISHSCYWVSSKTTEIKLTNTYCYGSGVPLNVILYGFKNDKDTVWFSTCYGYNVLLIGVKPAIADTIKKYKHNDTSPIETALGTPTQFQEYELTEDIQRQLGIIIDEEKDTYSVLKPDIIEYQIDIHDDCFSSVWPANEDIINQIVLCILQLHSYYLNVEVDWSSVLGILVDRLKKDKCLRLKSNANKKCLLIGKEEDLVSSIKSLLGINRSLFCKVMIQDGKAFLLET